MYKLRERDYYREKIVEMVGEINNQDCLFKIYHYILAKYRRDCKEKEEKGN